MGMPISVSKPGSGPSFGQRARGWWSHFSSAARYWVVMVVLAVVAATLFIVAVTVFHDHDHWSHRLSASLAEALVISLVIGVAVEPYVRSNFVKEVMGDAIWGMINPNAPALYREALGRIAGHKLVYDTSTWRLHFEWVGDDQKLVQISIANEAIGRNVDTKPQILTGPTWILASCESYTSRFTKWSLIIPETSTYRVYDESQLAKILMVTGQPRSGRGADGSVALDKEYLGGDSPIPAAGLFLYEARGIMTRHSVGYLPLIYSISSLETRLFLDGPALGDLRIRIAVPGEAEVKYTGENQIELSNNEVGTVLAGQQLLVSWKLASGKGKSGQAGDAKADPLAA